MTVRFDELTVDWLGYATARLQTPASPVVYLDPGRYGVLTGDWEAVYGDRPHPRSGALDPRDGDIVLVTHDHHYQDDGIRRVADADATLVAFEEIDAERIADNRNAPMTAPEDLPYDVRRVAVGDSLEVDGVSIDVIPAYNHPDGRNVRDDGTPVHPEGFGCGFLVTLDDRRCCWPGDSDVLPQHEALDLSLLLPSISRSFTMNRQEAAELAARIRPDLVVPIHYNTFPALEADSRAFAADVAAAGVPVALDES